MIRCLFLTEVGNEGKLFERTEIPNVDRERERAEED